MFSDLIKDTKIRNKEHFIKLLDDWDRFDPRIGQVLDNFTEKLEDLEKKKIYGDELLEEAANEIKNLRKILEENKIEYETK
jgi:uncharacterized protein YdcH (DUF465 family)